MTQPGAGRGARVLPDGFAVRLSGRVRSFDEGRTLVGGSRAGVVFLSATAAELSAQGGTVVVHDAVSGALARRLLDAGMADPVWETPLPPLDDVTVVVPVRDRAFPLDRLLRTVEQLDPGTPVVVVDDGSTDPGALEVVADRHGARLVRHPVNRGPAAARNTGLREVATAYVAFCDSDVVPTGGWLRRLRRHLEDPAVALVAPRVLGMEPAPGDGALARYEQVRSSLDLGPVAGSVRAATPISYVPSACLAGRVAALGSGFDETLRVAEDVDLVWRLVEDGWTVRYEPEAVVRHDHRTELRAWLARKAYYGTGAAPLARRHGDAVAPMVLAPWSALACAALLAQRRWSAPVAAGGDRGGGGAAAVAALAQPRTRAGSRPTWPFAAGWPPSSRPAPPWCATTGRWLWPRPSSRDGPAGRCCSPPCSTGLGSRHGPTRASRCRCGCCCAASTTWRTAPASGAARWPTPRWPRCYPVW